MALSKTVDRQWVMEYVKKWQPELLAIRAAAQQQIDFFNGMLPQCEDLAKSAQRLIEGMKKESQGKVESARAEERARIAKTTANKSSRSQKAGGA